MTLFNPVFNCLTPIVIKRSKTQARGGTDYSRRSWLCRSASAPSQQAFEPVQDRCSGPCSRPRHAAAWRSRNRAPAGPARPCGRGKLAQFSLLQRCLLLISFLRRDASRLTPTADLPSSFDVGANLAQQVVKVGEGPGRTQARQEIEFHGAAVEIAGESNKVGFDLADLLAEGRVRADVAGGRPGPRLLLRSGNEDSGGIDAVEREQGIDAVEIDGRNAQPGAPTCAVGHNAPDAVRAAEKSRGLLDLALVQRLADSR